MATELKFAAYYAESVKFNEHKDDYSYNYRASRCRNCSGAFKATELRLIARVQSLKFDGRDNYLYHLNCFFEKQRPHNINEIENYENIQYDDQQKIRKKLDAIWSVLAPTSSESKGNKGTKRPLVPPVTLSDYTLEYSPSNRAECVGCRTKIMKNIVRVKKMVYFTELAMQIGGQPFCHHVECFNEIRGNEYGFYLCGDKIPGFNRLSAEDKKAVKEMIPAISPGSVPSKIAKIAPTTSTALENAIEAQTKMMSDMRDKLKAAADIKMLQKILTLNNSDMVDGYENILNRCADFLTFGALAKCQKCLKGDMVFAKHGYKCNGKTNEWVDCGNFSDKPLRVKCKIPPALKKSSKAESFFATFKPETVQDRAVRPYVKPFVGSSAHDVKVQRKREPLYNMHVVPIGKFTMTRPEMKQKVEALGGKLVTTLQPQIAVVISTDDEVEKMNKRMREVEMLDIQVVPESFLDSIKNGSPQDTVEAIKSMSICDWGSDPLSRIPQEEDITKREDFFSRGTVKVAQVKVKNGAAIFPDSGLDSIAHVYSREGVVYTSVLGLTDISKNKNSFFKMQVLRSDNLRQFWLYTSWGRIGTKIGDSKKEDFQRADMACVEFERIYKDKTGNKWTDRDNFQKRRGKYCPLEIDAEDDKKLIDLTKESSIPSDLDQKVQDLVKILFDTNLMKQTMIEFQLDMKKMPLGRLSKKQLQEANQTLSDISDLLARGATEAEFVGLSNKFYTQLPHSFGMRTAPIIDTTEMIKNKREMIESLLEIEIAYSMMQEDTDEKLNPLDCRYKQLKTKLKPLEHDAKEFKMVEKYVRNTHGETHTAYKLIVEDVFKVKRQNEAERYKPFKQLHNRQLLWHGSRITNFVGILSQGLKIAPPEAPATGYMFGKGIYFADMVSKSANYCFSTEQQTTGMLLLSEVALGDTHELKKAQYVTTLPEGKHSVKGMGKTFPDPAKSFTRKDGVIVPLGKSTTSDELQSSLLYNEYIVYDAAQVNVQYLIKMKFDYTR